MYNIDESKDRENFIRSDRSKRRREAYVKDTGDWLSGVGECHRFYVDGN